jgi:DNA recombination protein RmuC
METAIPFLIIGLCIAIIIFLVIKMQKPRSEDLYLVTHLKEEIQQLQLESKQLNQLYIAENNKATRAEEALATQRELNIAQQANLEKLHQQFTLEFSAIANKLLEEKSAKFTLQNQSNLDLILNPLKENIKAFEQKVDKVYQAEAAERSQLKGVIFQLMDQSKQIQTDANNLTRALKGDNKKQGNWGEVILERVLETSGLVKDREYLIQKSLNDGDGGRFQPDVIINLPDDKNLIVDAKISLVAYEKMVNAENEEDKPLLLRQHILSIKAHIDGLSSKNYQHLYNINSPDFVLLFIPIEASFSATVQADTEIFNYAWNKKVVLVSPTTLLATLRTIASIWKVDRQNKNVFEIAEEAGSLYDKFVGFLEDMEKIGKHIDQTQKAHSEAFKKLQYGSGNLISKVEKIKKLGAKTKASKQIDNKFLSNDDL